MLALAHDLEAEPLGGRGRRVRRGLDDGGAAVIVEELGDRDDALLLRLLLLHRVERRGETGELGARRIERVADAHGGGDAAQHGRGGAEHGEALGADLGLAALEWMRGVFGGLEHVGERRMILHAGDAAHGAHAPQHVGGGVAVGGARRQQLGAGADVRRLPSRGSRRRTARAGCRPPAWRRDRGRSAPARRSARASARRRPDSRRERSAAGACSRPRPRRAHRRAPGSHRVVPPRKRRDRHARSPAAISANAVSLAIVALPRRARATRCSARRRAPGVGREQQRIELLDVLARFEDEEVEKACRGRHAGSDLVCKSGRPRS